MPTETKSSGRKTKTTDPVREALKRRTRETLSKEVSFITNVVFRDMDAAGLWRKVLSDGQTRESKAKPVQGRLKMPAHLERLCDTPLLAVEEERELFRNMNYLKYRANALRSSLKENRPSLRKLDQIDALLAKADVIRNEIVSANTRLIVSIVKKFANESNPFDDMLSEGIASLMNAVEKFDYARGFRFSTYATMVVRRQIYRTMQRVHRTQTRFVTGNSETLNEQENYRELSSHAEVRVRNVEPHLLTIMGRLDEREKLIVSARCGFIDLGMKATFSNLGQKLGISKERVRQLELRAVERLRVAARELGVFNELRSLVSQ